MPEHGQGRKRRPKPVRQVSRLKSAFKSYTPGLVKGRFGRLPGIPKSGWNYTTDYYDTPATRLKFPQWMRKRMPRYYNRKGNRNA